MVPASRPPNRFLQALSGPDFDLLRSHLRLTKLDQHPTLFMPGKNSKSFPKCAGCIARFCTQIARALFTNSGSPEVLSTITDPAILSGMPQCSATRRLTSGKPCFRNTETKGFSMSEDEILSPQQRIVDIQRACAIAGCPGKAGQFISQGRDVGAVLGLLLKQKIAADDRARANAEKPAGEIHNRPLAVSSTAASWDRVFADVEARAAAGIVIER